MSTAGTQVRRASKSAPVTVRPATSTPIERICRALELGRRGRLLEKRAKHGRSATTSRPR